MLLLFDIDGTMVRVRNGLSREVFYSAFKRVHGIDRIESPEDYSFHGRTDRSIYFDLSEFSGVARADAVERSDRFVDDLVASWNDALDESTVEVLPGVVEILDILELDSKATLGLLTGNVRAGARAKLDPHRLYERFVDGAFGSDAVDRNDLPPIALDRIGRRLDRQFEAAEAVIVGDSTRDIACARAHGLQVIAVATGGDDVDLLERHKPDLLLDSLSDPEPIVRFLSETLP